MDTYYVLNECVRATLCLVAAGETYQIDVKIKRFSILSDYIHNKMYSLDSIFPNKEISIFL